MCRTIALHLIDQGHAQVGAKARLNRPLLLCGRTAGYDRFQSRRNAPGRRRGTECAQPCRPSRPLIRPPTGPVGTWIRVRCGDPWTPPPSGGALHECMAVGARRGIDATETVVADEWGGHETASTKRRRRYCSTESPGCRRPTRRPASQLSTISIIAVRPRRKSASAGVRANSPER